MIVLPPLMLELPDEGPSNEQWQTESGSYVFRDEAILGTRMRIDVTSRNFSDAQAAAIDARNEVDRWNAILNSRNPNSELSALNRSRTHRASPELFAVVEAAERWRAATAGAFSGRLGRTIALWQNVRDKIPSKTELARVTRAAEVAHVELDAATRTITRPDEVEFALDALAKGWIVDRAYEVARSAPGVTGALVEIGGDIRCGGTAPDANGWCVSVPDARVPVDNAPLVATVQLFNHAIATSGRGPRDRLIDGQTYSPTLSSRDGWPVRHAISATTIAASAAEADAMATALLAMPIDQAIAWAEERSIAASVQTELESRLTQAGQARFAQVSSPRASGKTTAAIRWPKDWVALVTFTAPPRQLVRDEHFRSPYMAMWISDLDNKPIRTLLLVGRQADWQKDNYIWWALNNGNVKQLMATRSMSTSGSGIYKMLWDGTDDQFQEVPGGTYVLHVETSRERGKHTHRSLTIDFSKGREFTEQIPTSEEAGGVNLNFYRP